MGIEKGSKPELEEAREQVKAQIAAHAREAATSKFSRFYEVAERMLKENLRLTVECRRVGITKEEADRIWGEAYGDAALQSSRKE